MTLNRGIGAPEDDELTILTGGNRLGGWTAIRVERGVELLPSHFSVELTERYPGELSPAMVQPFAPCEVFLGRDKILTGYIDLYWPHEDAGSHVVSIQGRSKTEDLVDCSLAPPTVPPWVINNPHSLKQITEKICQPFGIAVSLPDGDFSLDGVPSFVIQPGETCAQLLDYIARAAQALLWDDGEGRLVVSKVGSKRAATALREGVNCEVSDTRISGDQRYSVIEVIGVAPTPPTADGDQYHTMPKATAKDPGVPRYRPKYIIMDNEGPNLKWPQQRADWEVTRRYGRSRLAQVSVTGWRGGDGALWQPNTIVAVDLPSLKMQQDCVIAACSWLRGGRGTYTLLTLMPKEGLMPAPFHFDLSTLRGFTSPATDAAVAKGAT